MPRSLSRLFRAVRTPGNARAEVATVPETARTPETEGAPETPAILTGQNRRKWHQEVTKSYDVLDYLTTGHPPVESINLKALKRPTVNYLQGWEANHVRPIAQRDAILDTLIYEHAIKQYDTRDLATLACLHVLSVPSATVHLLSLMDLDVGRYLRCVTLAATINSHVVSSEELLSAQCILRLLSSQGQAFEEFQHMIEALGSGAPVAFVLPKVIQSALAVSKIGSRLQKEVETHLEKKRFASAFLLVSWLKYVPGIPNNNNVIAVLNQHLPSWPWLRTWRPNTNRITQWERGKFTDLQRKKLSCLFDLDGPDTATRQRESLKMAEPQCYQHFNVQPQSTGNLEKCLDLLFRAYRLGPNALDLFIHFCVDNIPDETVLTMVDLGINTDDDSYCKKLFVILRALSPQATLTNQMGYLIQALPVFNDGTTAGNLDLSTEYLASCLASVTEKAQETFRMQLESGTGENIGMLIHDLGAAILQASWIHPYLPSDFLAQFRQFPSSDVLGSIFDQLDDCADSSNPVDARFKSYLAAVLGGRSAADEGTITLAAIGDEVRFWNKRPSTVKRDLAKILGKFQRLDYSLYTSCILAMLEEDDMFLTEMRPRLIMGQEKSCLDFASYLARRRNLNQLQNECWLLLLVSMIKEQSQSFLPRMANSMSLKEWLEWIDGLIRLLTPISSRLPPSGAGITQERLLWWMGLSQNMPAVQYLLKRQGGRGNLTWLYFPTSQDHIIDLVDIIKEEQSMTPIQHQVVSYISPNGNNVILVCDCIRAIKNASANGRAICERIICRKETSGEEEWSEAGLAIVLEAWRQRESFSQEDRAALGLVGRLLGFPEQLRLTAAGSRLASERLESEYGILLRRARKLETLRLRLRQQRPQPIADLLQRLDIDNTSNRRAADDQIPDELVDAVDPVGENEYELSFALTGINDLQRRARGISEDSRMVLVRLYTKGVPQFCIHFSPNDEAQHDDQGYHQPAAHGEPDPSMCTRRQSLFKYLLYRNVHQILHRHPSSLKDKYLGIQKLITGSPATCIVCSGSMNVKLWKPATCSINCNFEFQNAPLEVRLHNLLVDPLSIDLLLTCVYEAAADESGLDLLPGCPIPKDRVRSVIDSFPPLETLQTVADLRSAIHGYSDGCGMDRENLLSWLCLRFRGFMMAAPEGYKIPSMSSTKQFLMLNSHHERERLFDAQLGLGGGSGAVFHGTRVARLFLILTDGLRNMTNTQFMMNGGAHGAGIYCADEQATSLPFAGTTGKSWKNSSLSNMRVMLGCELASYASAGYGVHVVANEDRLLVRYVFLLPHAYQPPPRHHVEPAMKTAFANLRSGLLT